jgi:ABC-2 type transport system permease protein
VSAVLAARAQVATPRRAGLRGALRAEWTKLWTATGTGWLLLATVLLTAGVGAAASATAGPLPEDPTRLSLTGVDFGQAVVAVLAVLLVGNEYSSGMIRVSLAAVPRRWSVLVAKAAVLTVVVLPAAVFGVLGCVVAGRVLLPGPGITLPPATGGLVLRAAVGSVLYVLLIALLSLGTAVAVRDSAAAIGLVLGVLYVLPILTQVVTSYHWRRHLEQLAPMSAGLAVQATTGLRALPIGPWAGLGVLAGWAALALLAGWLLLGHRDA